MQEKDRSQASNKKQLFVVGICLLLIILVIFSVFYAFRSSGTASKPRVSPPSRIETSSSSTADSSQIEKDYLAERFAKLKAVNSETIGYVYAPGTQLDEPVVQTKDNETYLLKTFEGKQEPYMGAVFMDKDNHKDFSDRLTWLFGHARGSKAGDHRMFNDVNYYDHQDYFDKHRYVVIETPERKYYYQAMGLVIVPEETAFYRTEFKDDEDFTTQLRNIYEAARTKDPKIKIKASDRYLVLSTCREEDDTIRSNLYLRQIPDSELADFLAKHGKELTYTPTR